VRFNELTEECEPYCLLLAIRVHIFCQHSLFIHLIISLLPRLTVLLVTFLFASFVRAQSQQVPSPKREVRAVWITTAAGLDWPKTYDKDEQQASLRRMVAELKAANFNTIFFQTRARGDAYYRSSYEPWAENLTGSLGRDPGWDPLAFLLAEAHAAGMELHAWFNVYKVRGPGVVAMSSPQHPVRSHPEWIVEQDGEGWLDPGIPDVRNYLLRVSLELARRYNIDGMHFDFVRYPGREFPDAESFRRYGNGMNRDDWRRANIDRFIAEFYDAATAMKPMLKIGSAPLGVFSVGSGERKWGAYHSYYQDSQGWLRNKKQDYLVPQIYWNLGESTDDPDFAELARQWRTSATGRHVYAGIGAYKPEVLEEIAEEIDTVRAVGLDGQAFFRYEHIKDFNVLQGRYVSPANIPPMPWKDPIPPLQPQNLAVAEIAPGVFHLEWTPPPPARDHDTARFYNIYRSPSPKIAVDEPASITAMTSSSLNNFVDTLKSPGAVRYYYAVTAFDKGNNESSPSNTGTAVIREMVELSGKLSNFTSLSASVSPSDRGGTLIAYKLAGRMFVSLELLRIRSDSSEGLAATYAQEIQQGGTYIVALGEGVTPGIYLVRLKAGSTRIEQQLEIR